MKKSKLVICLYAAAGLSLSVLVACSSVGPVHAQQAEPVSDNDIGLSKTSVFDDPTPDTFSYGGSAPGAGNELIPTSYDTAPPQIPHSVVGLMPVTAQSNICVGCHVVPDSVGKEVAKGMPIPVPASHYDAPAFGKTDAGLAPTTLKSLAGSRYVCTQCHRPQATVDPLVQSNFDTAYRKKIKK